MRPTTTKLMKNRNVLLLSLLALLTAPFGALAVRVWTDGLLRVDDWSNYSHYCRSRGPLDRQQDAVILNGVASVNQATTSELVDSAFLNAAYGQTFKPPPNKKLESFALYWYVAASQGGKNLQAVSAKRILKERYLSELISGLS